MKVNIKNFNFIYGVLLFWSFLFQSVCFSVQIMGAISFECPPNGDSVIGIPLRRETIANGILDSVNFDTLSIIPAGETFWKENQFKYDGAKNSEHYYILFTSGALEGAWFDIIQNTSSSVSLNIGKNDLSLLDRGDKFEIIAHWTLNKLFPNGGVLKKNDIPAKCVNCSIIAKYTYYDKYGNLQIPEGSNNPYQKFFYYRKFNDEEGWRERRSGNIDFGNQIIEPNAFMVLRQPKDADKLILKIPGQVSNCASVIEVIQNSDLNQESYTAFPSCSDVKLSDLTESFIESGLMKESVGAVRPLDALLVYDNHVFDENRPPSGTYFYYNGTLSPKGWYKIGSGSPTLRKADNAIISAGSGLVILKKAGSEDNFLRVKYFPPYLKK